MLKPLFSTLLYILIGGFILCPSIQAAPNKFSVDANQYQEFWLWGRIPSAPYLSRATSLYVLQGEIQANSRNQRSVFIQQGVPVLSIPEQKVWLVFRNHHLNWQGDELTKILQRVKQWEHAGNQIIGIQIDFDARTKNLHDYALFLQRLRTQLPKQYQLSTTSLMDWTNLKDKNTLRLFRENINELVIQTYQGSRTIPQYQAYLSKISALQLPYKIGLVQYGEWNPNLNFSSDPNFKGFIVFLLRAPPSQALGK
ncbi:DUF3142 domain-containing protein [Acinetobacter sp. MD2]|uniref:DUF3142 domain-containing protein n=1 Tax=Acinetobacter sp. MD2 TaxID=2600066 RepID=UPI002D1E89A7|nr:DUF3142 domain-containing protein [Acinetobacter sp. MD2]MEB3767871.1 DUF3142 domain-containing protein [Acinetobacter sp. MD2]